jgi:hypothetical protein
MKYALWKLIQALELQGDTAEAIKRRQQLTTDFPEWIPPVSDPKR